MSLPLTTQKWTLQERQPPLTVLIRNMGLPLPRKGIKLLFPFFKWQSLRRKLQEESVRGSYLQNISGIIFRITLKNFRGQKCQKWVSVHLKVQHLILLSSGCHHRTMLDPTTAGKVQLKFSLSAAWRHTRGRVVYECIHSFYALALDGGEWFISRFGRFNSKATEITKFH